MARKGRADIQALRAIAVVLVVLNHLWPARLTGGYVGVDVFFVISGFLITAHLLGEIHRTGRVSLPAFYARRARRLLPAALLVAVVSLAGTLLWLPAERWERVAREVFAASAYVLNWVLSAGAVDYWAGSAAATPVQHYWSLSVEEQFYLLWPLTLLVVAAVVRRRSHGIAERGSDANRPALAAGRGRGALLAVVGVLAVASVAFAVWQTGAERSAAYFNTFGRAWEFMLGALLAVLGPALAVRGVPILRGIAQLVGYAAIAVSALAFDDATAFPGPWALLPAVGTALVIAAGPQVPRWSPARLLHWRPIQYTGDISYSLYLWHWPLIVLAPFALSRELRFIDRVLLAALALALAAATKHLVEDPGRTRLFRGARPRRSLLAALGSVLVIGVLALGVGAWARGLQARNLEELAELRATDCFGAAALGSDDCADPFGTARAAPGGDENAPWAVAASECALAPPERQILVDGKPSLVACDFSLPSDAGSPPSVWLLGDSHAEHWRAAVTDVARGNGWRLTSTMQGGCPSVPTPLAAFQGDPASDAKRQGCLDWGAETSQRILADRPDLVLVSNFAAGESVDDGSGRGQAEQLAAAFDDSLRAWTRAGATVVVIRDAPTAGALLGPDCVLLHGDRDHGCTADTASVLPPDPMADAVALAADPEIRAMDLTDRFCNDGICSGVIGGLPVYFDQDHVSRSYAETLAPVFAERLGDALGSAVRPPEPAPDAAHAPAA